MNRLKEDAVSSILSTELGSQFHTKLDLSPSPEPPMIQHVVTIRMASSNLLGFSYPLPQPHNVMYLLDPLAFTPRLRIESRHSYGFWDLRVLFSPFGYDAHDTMETTLINIWDFSFLLAVLCIIFCFSDYICMIVAVFQQQTNLPV